MKIEYLFKIKEIFNPEDKLSRWILKLAIARNDIFHVHNIMLDHLEHDGQKQVGERTYLFRLGISHLREVLKLISIANEITEIRVFVNKQNDEIREHFNNLTLSKDDNFLKEVFMPIRNNIFHYYDKDKDKEFEERLSEMNNFFTRFIMNGKSIKEMDYIFADEVSFNVSFGNISNGDLIERIKKLSQYMSSFIALSDSLVGHYLASKKLSMNRIITR